MKCMQICTSRYNYELYFHRKKLQIFVFLQNYLLVFEEKDGKNEKNGNSFFQLY